jgi:hypothetical protein
MMGPVWQGAARGLAARANRRFSRAASSGSDQISTYLRETAAPFNKFREIGVGPVAVRIPYGFPGAIRLL